ncbi:MAG TPA: SDR family oxidoreductase [Solimonas sp.]
MSRQKFAMVIGGSRGIGAAIVRRLAADGFAVAFTYREREDCAAQLCTDLGAHKIRALRCDSADAQALQMTITSAAGEHDGIEVLVNNAGAGVFRSIEELTLADFDQMVTINLRAVFVAIQAALPHMERGGRIINIGSCNAERVPNAGSSVYAMSKAGLVGLVKGLARDLAPRGITINNVQPGPVDTDMNPADTDFARMMIDKVMAVPRYGTPAEVAALVSFIAGSDSAYLTGASINLDGGYTA